MWGLEAQAGSPQTPYDDIMVIPSPTLTTPSTTLMSDGPPINIVMGVKIKALRELSGLPRGGAIPFDHRLQDLPQLLGPSWRWRE